MRPKEPSLNSVQDCLVSAFDTLIAKDIPFATFRDLRTLAKKILGSEIKSGLLTEAIGALKSQSKIGSLRIGPREIYYLKEMVQKYKESRLNTRSKKVRTLRRSHIAARA